MKLRWLHVANRSRSQQSSYVAEDNPAAALRMDDEIERQVDRLLDHPDLGRSGRAEGTRELVIARTPFIAVYSIDANEITILRILHGTQDWPPTKPKP